MNERVFRHMLEQNNRRRQELQDFLGAGSAKDYAEYREVVGVLRGLLQANQNIEELMERAKEMDND
jgi:hypothetical protein